MKVTTWAVFGSVIINLALGLALAAMFSVAPPVHATADTPAQCAATHSPDVRLQTHVPDAGTHRLLTAARMGWVD